MKQTICAIVLAMTFQVAQAQLCKELPSKPNLQTLQARYLFGTDGGVTYNELHIIKGEKLVLQYSVSPEMIQSPNGMIIPASKYASSYLYKGKIWVDEKADGVNCNETLHPSSGKQL